MVSLLFPARLVIIYIQRQPAEKLEMGGSEYLPHPRFLLLSG